jgi:hypothetical protein
MALPASDGGAGESISPASAGKQPKTKSEKLITNTVIFMVANSKGFFTFQHGFLSSFVYHLTAVAVIHRKSKHTKHWRVLLQKTSR